MKFQPFFLEIFSFEIKKSCFFSFYTSPLSKCRHFRRNLVMDGKPGSSYATICESYQTLLVTPPTSQTLHYSMDWAVILRS